MGSMTAHFLFVFTANRAPKEVLLEGNNYLNRGNFRT